VQKEVTLLLTPRDASDEKYYRQMVAGMLKTDSSHISHIRVTRRSIDARKRDIKINLTVQVFIDEPSPKDKRVEFNFKDVSKAAPVIVVGAGPAGLFAALRLIELGFKPVIFERGKEIHERKKDIALITREHLINPDSNYCFGEGGAGTFSDGKLYTRSNKRGNLQKVYEMFYYHGAHESVLYDAHPHIGTDKLPEIIKSMRETITGCGGQMYFNTRVVNVLTRDNEVAGVVTQKGDTVEARAVILATGHSARDVYWFLNNNSIALEAKPFAMGVRVEHPQELIDNIQYHGVQRGEFLPAASYSLVSQIEGRGVFSFCMCPGGFIVPSATQPNELVVNGMSASKRNSPYANSGIVVEITKADTAMFSQHGELAGLMYQQHLENLSWQQGGCSQAAPTQRLADFVKGKPSSSLPKVSYTPGITASPMHQWLPPFMANSLRKGFESFNNKMHGFVTNEAAILGVESRTSSPVRIPRDRETYQHIQVKGLFPCGEGSGYAGGIASSAIDGENCAGKVVEFLSV
jgi:uncharacterized FAD-dependent dehydrogenase